MAKDMVAPVVDEQNKIASEEEKKSWIQKILDKIRQARLALRDAFIDVPADHAIYKNLDKAKSAVERLDELEEISEATLQGMYDISCTLETAVKKGSLEEMGKMLEKLEKLCAEVTQQAARNMLFRYDSLEDALETATRDSKVHFKKEMIEKARVVMSEDGKRAFLILPEENDDPNHLKYNQVFELGYKESPKGDDVSIKLIEDATVEADENGSLFLRGEGDKYLRVNYNEDKDHRGLMNAQAELVMNIRQNVASIVGLRTYEEKLKAKSPEVRMIEKYRRAEVVDPETGYISTFNPDDATFRIYDPDTKDMLVLTRKDADSNLEGHIYKNVPSYDANLYGIVPQLDEQGNEKITETPVYDKDDIKYDRIKVSTITARGEDGLSRSHISLPRGAVNAQYMFHTDAMKDFLRIYGFNDFGIEQITNVGNKDGIIVDKTTAVKSKDDYLRFADTLYNAVFAAEYGVEGVPADSKVFEETHKVAYDRGGHTFTINSPENTQLRVSMNRAGAPVSIEYRPKGERDFQKFYNVASGATTIPAPVWNAWRKDDPSFSNMFNGTLAAIDERVNKQTDLAIEHAKSVNNDRKELEERLNKSLENKEDKPKEKKSQNKER